MKTKPLLPTLLALALLTLPAGARAQAGSSESAGPVDYSDGSNWLCRPGRRDACTVDLTTTVVSADGTLTREEWSADPRAPIDCFYVYPTVSTDQTTNSDMTPDDAERRVVEEQFARFASVCRPYAPSYRQVTLAGLRSRLAGSSAVSLDQGMGYDDVLNAFRYYIANDNDGRGFVLIGHSQGSYILTRLIAEEIDGRPLQARFVSAIIPGSAPTVPEGRDVGGSFHSIPLCHSSLQTGCVVAFSTFRSTVPPPENSLFGRPPAPGLKVACTNPAALGGGSGELHSYLSSAGSTIVGARPAPAWVESGPAVETPFVSVPGLLSARCATNQYASYLELTVHGDPSDPRVDDIVGDITPQWGLHLVDMNVAMGNLISLVRQQAIAWEAAR